MNVQYGKSIWGMGERPIHEFFKRAKADHFNVVEIDITAREESTDEIRQMALDLELQIIAQVWAVGSSPEAQLASFKSRLEDAIQVGVCRVNALVGKEYFPFEGNLSLYEYGIGWSKKEGIPLSFETHRGRPTFSLVTTVPYLQSLPEMRLTGDFSHWMVVHESDLSDMQDLLEIALQRTDYIHARVGHAQAPQISDPSALEWKPELQNHLQIWQRVLDMHHSKGSNTFLITPEFGPPNYMPTFPFTRAPTADAWEANVFMRDWLKERL